LFFQEGILMIEGAADFLPEELMVTALKMGHAAIGDLTASKWPRPN